MRAAEGPRGHADVPSTVTITTKDGRELTCCVEAFKGTPARPFERADMREKFLMLTRNHPDAETMFERLQSLEEEDRLDWLA